MKIKLTEAFIANQLICPPGKKRVEFVDVSDAVGLYIEVRSTSQGQGTWYLRYKDQSGTTRHAKIGNSIDTDLATAREKARFLRAQVALGGNPRP